MPAACLAFFGGAIGGPELLVIAVVVLIFFGPKRLPEIARSIGKTIAQLRQGAQDFKDQITREVEESAPRPAELPPANPPPPAVQDQSGPAASVPGRAEDGTAEPPSAKETPKGESSDGLAG